MKKLLIISIAIFFSMMAVGQTKVKTTIALPLFEKPDINSRQTIIYDGGIIELGEKEGTFLKATYNNISGFLLETSLKFCIPPDSIIPVRSEPIADRTKTYTVNSPATPLLELEKLEQNMQKAGENLYTAGSFLLTGLTVGVTGSLLSIVLTVLTEVPFVGILVGTASIIFTIYIEVMAYRELMAAGDNLKYGRSHRYRFYP